MWQQLVGNWLAQRARAQVFEQMTAAARDAVYNSSTSEPRESGPAQPARSHAALVFALGEESAGVVDQLSARYVTRAARFKVHHGRLRERSVLVVETGVGRTAAAEATEALLAGHRVDWVVSTGFAGGLTDSLQRGDILLVDTIVDLHGHVYSVDLRVDPSSLAATPGVHVGRLLTNDGLVRTTAEKRALGARHQAVAVDMETAAVAEVCRAAGQRMLAVRVISDPVDEELPADIETLLDQTTTAGRLGAAASVLWRRPGRARDLWQLKERALVNTDRLARFLADMLGQLTPRSDASAGTPQPPETTS